MKKKLSGLGLLFMLLVKHPPLPDYNIFRKIDIVAVCAVCLKKIALEFRIN